MDRQPSEGLSQFLSFFAAVAKNIPEISKEKNKVTIIAN
jgi:hypothetical protein